MACPTDRGFRPFDYGTLNPDATELWFPRFFGIEAWDYPGLTDTLFTVSLGGSTPNRGAMTVDAAGIFYVAADLNIFAVDGTTHAVSTLTSSLPNPAFGLVWHPLDSMLYAILWDGTAGSFAQIDPVAGTVTTLVAGPTNGFAAPTNYNGSGTDYPLVATDHYVVSAYDATQTPADLFVWDVANAVWAWFGVINDGFVPTPVPDQIIGGTGGVGVLDLSTSGSTISANVNSTSPLLTCAPFAGGFFEDGFSRTPSGLLVFNDGSDIWEYAGAAHIFLGTNVVAVF